MSKTFRAWKIDEPLFLPPMVQDFVAKDHLARFVVSLVRDDLGLAEITGTYGSERGQPPFDWRCGVRRRRQNDLRHAAELCMAE
jgi:hypothetical protein